MMKVTKTNGSASIMIRWLRSAVKVVIRPEISWVPT